MNLTHLKMKCKSYAKLRWQSQFSIWFKWAFTSPHDSWLRNAFFTFYSEVFHSIICTLLDFQFAFMKLLSDSCEQLNTIEVPWLEMHYSLLNKQRCTCFVCKPYKKFCHHFIKFMEILSHLKWVKPSHTHSPD